MHPRTVVASYLLLQAAATAAWWLLLWLVPASAAWFQPANWPREALLGFWLGDLLLLVGGSLIAALFVMRDDRHARLAVWALAAAAWYPTLTCVGVSLLSGEAWIAAGLMVCLAGMTLAMATIYGTQEQSPALFRATPLAPQTACIWTSAQMAIFWSVFLGILPLAIVELQRYLGIAPFRIDGQSVIAALLFAAAASLGASSAYVMAKIGNGTPLPTAAAPKLVVVGPYRYVRNPMAIAGIGQAIAVGVFLESLPVIGYALLGAVIWHVAVRPAEEADLQQRFGANFVQYRKKVGIWAPRLSLRLLGSDVRTIGTGQ
ncbi:isoprenylcysteine carboxylmethyltransferase family protein [Blastopirellula sp. JC732]|uniref:Isoprenylcysteine carboxylmethyltransferase family protein n=1 Tax=Blastopirellula sediminis TaxID=2894196 RepID=A0A9X1MRV4_9BACT|nr:methyltransferase [Blastopirellula sediminis]MCC9606233.1 isoprenylcysteine carboxylmethyltransferase family protein [Blastopirellula sediminis]MCC9630469.1 isoprenylcysteine carboxylmethyltransferase family protein [Blastopirellula sediminis]